MRLLARALSVIALSTVVVLSALPALAHVTVRADTTEPGGFAKYTVRVPNESEDAATTRIEVQLPEGYEEARYQPLAGWGLRITDGVLIIEGGRIEPGQFQEFAFSARNPEQPGDVTFPAIQIYEDGEEVGWVGPPDSDEPAPVVTIEEVAAQDDGSDAEPTDGGETEPTEPAAIADPPPAETPDEPVEEATGPATEVAAPAEAPVSPDGGGSNVLSIIALVAGLLGLAFGGAAFARTRTAPGA